MPLQAAHPGRTNAFETRQSFSLMERYALRRAHPVNLFIDGAGWTWFTYFFWHHDWPVAVAAIIISRIFGLAMTANTNLQSMSETGLGKIALLHLHPVNMATQAVGLLVTLYGLWQHSTEFILVGMSVVLLGHLFGWSKVDRRFAKNLI